MVHILSSDCSHRIPGFKEQTEHGEVVVFQPDYVYIPAVDNKGMPLDLLLKQGSEVKVGTVLGVRKDFGIPVYSSVSGVIAGSVKKMNPVVGRPIDYLQIQNDKKGKRVFLKPLGEKPTKDEIVAKLKEGGIVGLGGAGFPSYIKYSAKCKIDTLIINAAECEPYLTTDYVSILKNDLTDFFKAIKVFLDACSIDRCLIVTKTEKTALLQRFTAEAGKFGDKRISVKGIKSIYPAGYERTMISFATGRSYGKLPSECGVIVNNFQTMQAIGALFFKGATIAEKVITVSGEVKNPANVQVPYGALIKDVIAFVGGYTIEKGVLLNGGPMCSEYLGTDDIPLLIQSDAITVLKPKTYVEQPCLRCGTCTAHCPCNLQPCEINFASKRGDYERCYDLGALDCVSCGLCSYVCPSHIDVSAGVKQAKLMVTFKVPRAMKKPAPAPAPAVKPAAPAEKK
jgi:electron transport complex protein RnfC